MKPVIEQISALQLKGFLTSNGTACRFVSITTQTPVVKIRVGNPFGQIIKKNKVVGESKLNKLSKKIGLINVDFVASVERKIAAATQLPESMIQYNPGKIWYTHVMTEDNKPLPLVQHKETGELYLQYYPRKSVNCYVNGQGEIVADETVKPWLHAESERSEFKPPVITLKLDNVVRMAASGIILEMPAHDEVEKIMATL
jgi:hypothetical protein